MTVTEVGEPLRGAARLTAPEFRAELQRTIAATAIERCWLAATDYQAFVSDSEVLAAAATGHMTRIVEGEGYATIQRLRYWTPERSEPAHDYHYSPPYLRPVAAGLLGVICREWAQRFQLSDTYALPVTSLVRSRAYQARLSQQHHKLTIAPETGDSSHLYGVAFDIDGCGLYRMGSGPELEFVNPRMGDTYGENLETVVASRGTLRAILNRYKERDIINYVEELPGTSDHCFHVCVRPC